MKRISIYLLFTIILTASCKKKRYQSLSGSELEFVNYSKNQALKFIDTSNNIHSLIQSMYVREYQEQIGLYGRTGNYLELYDVSYYSNTSNSIHLFTTVGWSSPSVKIGFCEYGCFLVPDSISHKLDLFSLNGITYKNVNLIKVYKNGVPNSNDTATIFHNREFGIIQLLFPSGKRIIRTN